MSARTRKLEAIALRSQSEIILGICNHGTWTPYFKLVISAITRDSAVKWRSGRLYKTNEQYAEEIGCSTKTVQRCINLAHEMGILHRTTWFRREAGKRFRNIKIKWNKLRKLLNLRKLRRKKKCPNSATKVSCRRASTPTHFDTNHFSDLAEAERQNYMSRAVDDWLRTEPETAIRPTNRLFIRKSQKGIIWKLST